MNPATTHTTDGIGIYIHVPYCRVICPYCDFVRARRRGDAPAAFADALIAEIRSHEGPRDVCSIFFGGGTPSLIAPADFERIVDALHASTDLNEGAEFTIEANPDDISDERILTWKRAGVNRISLGVQSFDDETLRGLGRCHNADTAHAACDRIGEHFDNWSLDLIHGLRGSEPDETRATVVLREDIATTVKIAPPHVSAYALTIEAGTPFAMRPNVAVDDDTSASLLSLCDEALAPHYDHYEISNFAKPGFHSLHNRIYWRNEAYAGFGPGAVSYLEGIRSRNAPTISGYLRAPGAKIEVERVSPRDARVETLIQHLRTRDGITADYYAARFGTELERDFAVAIEGLESRDLVAWSSDRSALRPTASGFALNDEIGLCLVESKPA